MKKKLSKIWSIGLTFILAVSLLLVAAPGTVSAADPVINEWDEFAYPDPGEEGNWFRQGLAADYELINKIGPMAEAINGDLYIYVELRPYEDDTDDHIFKSEDGGRTWEATDYNDLEVHDEDNHPDRVRDMVCSSIDEDIVYATDGSYVYKTDDGGDTWDFVAQASLEEVLGGACGCDLSGGPECARSYILNDPPITSIDVAYDDDDDPFVFIGTRAHSVDEVDGCTGCDDFDVGHPEYTGNVYWIGEAGYPAAWTDLGLDCFVPVGGLAGSYDALAVGCAPNWADSKETYVVVSSFHDQRTYVVSTEGVYCDWTEVAELVWNCVAANNFDSLFASRIGFPDDWEDTETMFVGVVGASDGEDADDYTDGGDVYSVSVDDEVSIDRNVRPGTGGCIGGHTNILSLDVCGDTDDGSLIAGAYDDADGALLTAVTGTTVYYSTDGGWEWDPSIKDPTGVDKTYVLWIGDCGESALAATAGCECAVSLSCVSEEEDAEEVGMSWNQISLIATDIDCVKDIDHSPGYITDSETLYMVTECGTCCGDGTTSSLFRNDGTYWERVFSSTTYAGEMMATSKQIKAVLVSPDFLDTETVFVANMEFDIFRSQDAGCSWDRIGYPCDPETIYSWAVLDEDTIYVGGAVKGVGVVYLTERHGGRPWDECVVEDEDDGTDAANIRYFAFDITDDTMTILVGDDDSQVFLCEVDPDEDWEDQEWHLVGAGTDGCEDVLEDNGTISDQRTCVAFDPGYAVTDDEGENMIYAAAHHVIARCIIDWDEDWADQEWTKIYSGDDDEDFWGMKVVGDTALYVGDTDDDYGGGMMRSLNPTEEDEDDIEFDQMIAGLDADLVGLRQQTVGENGCPDSNVLWSINSTEACDYTAGPEVWFFEDTLAFPVILVSPADGAEIGETTEVTLEWEDFCTAESYEIDLYRYCEECPDEEESYTFDPVCITCDAEDCVGCSDETCCYVVEGLDPGSTYYWSVRVCTIEDEEGEEWDMWSKWSEEQTFITEMPAVPYLCSPVCGAEDVIITPNFSWDAVADATSYEVQIATDEDFTDAVSGTSTVNAWLGAPELDYDTTYYWRVRALKDGVVSDWVVCIFTTEAATVVPVEEFYCPQCGLTFDSRAALEAHIADVHAPVTPAYIWVIIAVGALLVVAMLILIVRTRRVV